MTDAPAFSDLTGLENSQWLKDVKEKFARDEWPAECTRCEQAEKIGQASFRLLADKDHIKFQAINQDYVIVDLFVNNTCNAACAICGPRLSSLKSKMYDLPESKFNGLVELEKVPKDRILQINLGGGEPSVDPITREFVNNIPADHSFLNKVKINSNGSRNMSEIIPMLDAGINVRMSLSMDGTGSIFEYCRFPLSWSKFQKVLEYYQTLSLKYSNLELVTWSAYSALSIIDLPNMIRFSEAVGVRGLGTIVSHPDWLLMSNKNFLTLQAKSTLLQSDQQLALQYALLLATDETDTSDKFVESVKYMDSKRNSSFNSCYSHLNLRI